MSNEAKCDLCGEPMPKGEEMFNYHGYSGPCPKPPLPKPTAAMSERGGEAVRRVADATYRERADSKQAAYSWDSLLAALRKMRAEAAAEERRAQPLTTDERQQLYTLMQQWARNTDLQFEQVVKWIEAKK